VRSLQGRHIQRHYEAVITGRLIGGGTVQGAIGRHPRHRTRMAVVPNGKEAVTHYRIRTRFRAHTHVEVQLETGRTHQIRVHMAHLGHPLVGDKTYGARPAPPPGADARMRTLLGQFERQALHARRLDLEHPRTHAPLRFEAETPDDLRQLLAALTEDAADAA
jgi:23S rRNA pseudouridine1911/1915/1917 synthase